MSQQTATFPAPASPSAVGDGSPSISRRRLLAGIALGALGLALGSTKRQALAAKASDETLAALDAAQASYDTAMAQLADLGAQLEEAQYNLAQCQAEVDATNQQIAELEATIAARQQELLDAQDVLASRIRSSYTAGAAELIDLLFSATDFEDFVSRLYYAGKVNESDEAAIQSVKDIKAQLEADRVALEERRAVQEQLLAEQQAYTDELDATVAYYETYVANLSGEVQALMAQAQAELEAAQQAEYEAYIAAQQAQQNQGSGGDSGGSWDDSGYVPDGGGNGGGGGGGNHVYSVADIAWNYIGVPYVWGGTDPSGFDCSGLAQYCYAMAGYSIGRDTYAQAANISSKGQMVYSVGELQPGDLLFPHSGHVGIYIGNNQMIHAPYPGESVKCVGVYGFSFGGCPV